MVSINSLTGQPNVSIHPYPSTSRNRRRQAQHARNRASVAEQQSASKGASGKYARPFTSNRSGR